VVLYLVEVVQTADYQCPSRSHRTIDSLEVGVKLVLTVVGLP
jgi:hypothetical protein